MLQLNHVLYYVNVDENIIYSLLFIEFKEIDIHYSNRSFWQLSQRPV